MGQDDDLKQELQRNPHVQMQGRICSKERKNDQYIYSIDRVILKTDSDGKEPSSDAERLRSGACGDDLGRLRARERNEGDH